MKVSLLHRHNRMGLLFACLFMSSGIAFAEEKPSAVSEFLNSKYKDKTNRQWLNYFLPYFAPTEAKLKEQLKNDPNWAAFYSSDTSTQPLPVQSMPGPVSERSAVSSKPIGHKPEGALMAVKIPKGAGFAPPTVETQGPQPTPTMAETGIDKPVVLEEPKVAPASSIKPVVIGPSPVIPKESFPSIPITSQKSPYIGIWTGQYSKLIEYYDPNTKSWKASENSLRDVPVELKLEEKGLLTYKMHEREGAASYVLKDEIFSIICKDVRVRGDYFIEQENPQNLHLKTSRELVKDKMRVSLEFDLLLKQ